MTESTLFFINAASLLFFGVYMSAAFAGISFTKKNILICFGLCAFSGFLQIFSYIEFSEAVVWKLYPLITHLPLFIMLLLVYHKKIATVTVSVFTAYLCCQPAKWFGILVFNITKSFAAEYIARILTLVSAAAVIYFFFVDYISEIFNKDSRSACFFGITPTVYYIFDYATSVYSEYFALNNYIVSEFLPFFLCIVFMLFCVLYYKEYKQKSDAERKEHIIRLTVEEQKKEIEAVKRSEQEMRILRHDMRLLLNNISVCLSNNDIDTAKKIISAYVSSIDATTVKRYCENTTVNYTISSYAAKSIEMHTEFICQIDIHSLNCDETMLSTIISNALDNALNAQEKLPFDQRKINFMLKNHNQKILLSVKNPFSDKPLFVNGIPVSNNKGHGYGTQSIAYLTERMGGNCQFTTEGNNFVLRIVI